MQMNELKHNITEVGEIKCWDVLKLILSKYIESHEDILRVSSFQLSFHDLDGKEISLTLWYKW
jgi:hypothetical protein